MKNPDYRWLIAQRQWCEHKGCLMTLKAATEVVNLNGKDLVYCDTHAQRLKAARKSSLEQEAKREITTA